MLASYVEAFDTSSSLIVHSTDGAESGEGKNLVSITDGRTPWARRSYPTIFRRRKKGALYWVKPAVVRQ